MSKNTILNEIARPTTLEGFMCDETQKKKFQEFIDNQDIPHLGFFGLQGSGKTTLAKILTKNIDCDYIYLNATEERSMDVLKEKVGGFASTGTFKPLKVVILDEATHILEAGQVLLLNMIETFSAKTRFILTGNYPERLIPPLRSRLQEFPLIPPSKVETAKRVATILKEQGIKFKKEDLIEIINTEYPDLRSIFNTCQKLTLNGEIKLNRLQDKNENYQKLLLKELQNPTSKSINKIRQIIVDTNKSNFEDVYKFLYDNVDEYAPNDITGVIINLEEGMHRSLSRLDSEINIMSTISRILRLIS